MDPQLARPFANSAKEMIKQMTGIEVMIDDNFYSENEELVSFGISTIISFSGKVKGRLLLNLDPELALAIANKINQANYNAVSELMVLASISELNNIIAGDANTVLNNQYNLGLRLAPPIVFAGENTLIGIPKIASISINGQTEYGKLQVNIAFEGSI